MKAIVIVYSGDALSEAAIRQISDLVGLYARNNSRVEITPMSDSELAKTLVKGPTIAVGDFVRKNKSNWTQEDAAVVFFGEKYMQYINNEDAFLVHLLKDYMLIQRKVVKDSEDEAFINAMQALGKRQVVIAKDLVKKYNFTSSKLNRIYEIYKAL